MKTWDEAPLWARTSGYTTSIGGCCKGWIRLSRNAILVICSHRDHVPRERGVGRGAPTGFILKNFPRYFNKRKQTYAVKRYNMRFTRALQGKRPKLHDDHRSKYNRVVFWFSGFVRDEHIDYAEWPLTVREWILASAIMYFLG